MKILIIGGMGIIGGAIAESAAYNNDVWVLSRREIYGKYKNLNIHGISGDWKDDDVAKSAVKNEFDVIIDTLIFNVNQLRRDIGIVNGHCKQFIYISTDAIYLHPDHEVTEDKVVPPRLLEWDYGYNKRLAEQYLESHTNDFSFHWTIIRPTVTFGDTRIPVGFASRKNEGTLIKRIMEGKPVILFDEDEAVHSICYAKTFGESVNHLFMNGQATGQAFHISNDGAYTYEQILNCVAEILNKKGIFVRIPVKYLRYLSKPKYDEMIADKNPEFTLSNEKIKKIAYDVSFSLDIKAALSDAIEHLIDNNRQEDVEYDLISDAILMQYKRFNLDLDQKKSIQEYVCSFTKEYERKLKYFMFKRMIKTIIRDGIHIIKNRRMQ